MNMLKIAFYAAILLGEIYLCLVAIRRRVQNKGKVLATLLAILAMLAFFVTVAYIATPLCHWTLHGIVCPVD